LLEEDMTADLGLAELGCVPVKAEMTPCELLVVAMFRPRMFVDALEPP
jgi:hypothetical protein